MPQKVISVARDFSIFPGGRLTISGKWSGEEFRERVLIPALTAGVPFVLDLDGVKGYPTSFLEEAFGGLIRHDFTIEQIRSLMTLKCSKSARIDEINYYMEQEAERLQPS